MVATARDNRCGGAGAGELVGIDDIAPPLCAGPPVTGVSDRPTNGVALDLGVAWHGHRDAAERLLTDSSGVTSGVTSRVDA